MTEPSNERSDGSCHPDAAEPGAIISVVSPAYNESESLPLMYDRLVGAFDQLDVDWEWLVVDDKSDDSTFDVLSNIAKADSRVRGVRLARRSGSHTALACGLKLAKGDACIVMAADLQDPPETVGPLLAKWRDGFHVVWAVRAEREGERTSTVSTSRLYYWIMRNLVGLTEMPPTGADFMLLDRAVVDAFNEYHESTISVLALITWLGFRQTSISYTKAARAHGMSGWNLRGKFKLVVDSVTSFTYFPIRAMSYVGITVATVGFLYAGFVIVRALHGHSVQGWSSLMVAIVVIGGIQMTMLGVLGVYIWRALDEARRRPRFIVEATTSKKSKGQAGT